jgi:hypothetical protein
MKLENFEIHSSIELQSENFLWDLQNVAAFRGLELIPSENAAVMRWTLPSGPNPSDRDGSEFSGMTLCFKNLQFLYMEHGIANCHSLKIPAFGTF